MLNTFVELGLAGAQPLNAAASASAALFRAFAGAATDSGLFPASHFAAAAEMMERATRRYGKPAWGIESVVIDGKPRAVAEQTVLSLPFCDLVRFEREGADGDPRVLLVAPLSGHWATLLRGTVEGLLPGHDVYVTDWKCASDVALSQGRFGFDEYVDYVAHFLRKLGPGAAVVAVCQPTVPVLAAVSLLAEAGDAALPSAMVLMGGPIDVAAAPTEVTRLAERRAYSWFENMAVGEAAPWRRGAGRRIYAGWRQLMGFMSMKASDHARKHVEMFLDLARGNEASSAKSKSFYDEYLSVMDLDATFYLETIDRVFQRRLLARGLLDWRGHRVKSSAIRHTALMTVEGEADDISAPGQTVAAHALCSGIPDALRKHHVEPRVGHYGLFNGSGWRKSICPAVTAFIHAHATAAPLRKAA